MSAVQSVLAADTIRSGLVKQEADILARMDLPDEAVSLEEREDLSKRLEEVYLELRARGDASAEASARKILAGAVVCGLVGGLLGDRALTACQRQGGSGRAGCACVCL